MMAASDNPRTKAAPRSVRFAFAALLLTHALLLGWSACRQSPTLDEPAQLVSGIASWRFGRFDLYCVNPPLVRMTAALPVLASGAKTDWSKVDVANVERPEFKLGTDFVAANGRRSLWLFTLARWACIPFSLIGGWICFRWASDLFGESAGLLALGFWTFSPNILAHGQLITTDVPAASLGIAAAYAFWRWLKSPNWMVAFLAGLTLGLAELTKMTWLVLFGLWPVIWVIWTFSDRRRSQIASRRNQLAQLVCILGLGLYFINVGYAFHGSLSRLNSFPFASRFFSGAESADDSPQKGSRGNRFAGGWMGEIPVPLPRDYVLGLDLQKREFEDPVAPSYAGGVWQNQGWWYFYLYALGLKLPLATLVLAMLLAANRVIFRTRAIALQNELVLLAVLCSVLVTVSSQTGFSHHMRYVLPVLPFAYVWLSQAVSFANRTRVKAGIVVVLCIWSVGSSLWCYPHNLSYFNELAGGPRGGSRYLIHSDYDWGQDLIFLQEWLDDHRVTQPICLAYYGNFDPRDIGIEFELPPTQSRKRLKRVNRSTRSEVCAASVNFLRGVSRRAPDGRGGWYEVQQEDLDFLMKSAPVGRAGYSIEIYSVGPDD